MTPAAAPEFAQLRDAVVELLFLLSQVAEEEERTGRVDWQRVRNTTDALWRELDPS